MLEHKGEYFVNAEVEDILAQFERDMQVIPAFDNGIIRLLFKAKRLGNRIEVMGRRSDSIMQASSQMGSKGSRTEDDVEGFSYEVSRIRGGRSSVMALGANEFPFIQMLFHKYLARIGVAFDTRWRALVEVQLEEIEAEIRNEKEGHWGWTDWETDPQTGVKLRSLAFIPDKPNPNEPRVVGVGASGPAATGPESAAPRAGQGELNGERQEAWEAGVSNLVDKDIIRNLRKGLSGNESRRKLQIDVKTLYNRESVLRQMLSSDTVPYRKKWRQSKKQP